MRHQSTGVKAILLLGTDCPPQDAWFKEEQGNATGLTQGQQLQDEQRHGRNVDLRQMPLIKDRDALFSAVLKIMTIAAAGGAAAASAGSSVSDSNMRCAVCTGITWLGRCFPG